jgi:hypothetical protein
MKAVLISSGINRNGLYPLLFAGSNHAQRNFTPISYEYLLEQNVMLLS